MYLAAVILLALVLGGICLYSSFKVLKRFSWFLAWLRGTLGLILLGLSFCIIYAAFDLVHYEELLEERAIASVSFEKQSEQHYRATVSYYIDKETQEFDIYGDQWQVDARVIRWTGIVAALGAKPGFRLERISGRYYSLEDERSKPRSVFPLNDSEPVFDVWRIMNDHGHLFPGIDANYGSAAYLPMANAASFKLSLSFNGLTASPLNEIAKSAVQQWR